MSEFDSYKKEKKMIMFKIFNFLFLILYAAIEETRGMEFVDKREIHIGEPLSLKMDFANADINALKEGNLKITAGAKDVLSSNPIAQLIISGGIIGKNAGGKNLFSFFLFLLADRNGNLIFSNEGSYEVVIELGKEKKTIIVKVLPVNGDEKEAFERYSNCAVKGMLDIFISFPRRLNWLKRKILQ